MITILQCGKCKFKDTLKWKFEENFTLSKLVCSQYEDEIPDFVENSETSCPKFEEAR